MWKFLEWLMPRGTVEARKYWARQSLAKELGLYEAKASKVVSDVTMRMGIVDTDDMMSGRLGAPDSPYYEIQSANAFDKDYHRIQARTEKLLKNLPPQSV